MNAQFAVDTLTPLQMARWLRETAANTRQKRDSPQLSRAEMHLAPHVAFRLEQAAALLEAAAGGDGIRSAELAALDFTVDDGEVVRVNEHGTPIARPASKEEAELFRRVGLLEGDLVWARAALVDVGWPWRRGPD